MQALKIEVTRPECNASSTWVSAIAHLDCDLSPLLPYLNAVLPRAQYFPKIPFLRFRWQERIVAIERDQVRVVPFEDADSARAGAEKVIELLREIEAKKAEIQPNHAAYNPPTIIEIYQQLPRQSGCQRCGHPSCMAFAAALNRGEAKLEACVELQKNPAWAKDRQSLKERLGE